MLEPVVKKIVFIYCQIQIAPQRRLTRKAHLTIPNRVINPSFPKVFIPEIKPILEWLVIRNNAHIDY